MRYIETRYENTNGPTDSTASGKPSMAEEEWYLEGRDKRLEIEPQALLWKTDTLFHLVRIL